MLVDLHAKVRTHDGEDLGHVDRVLLDRERGEITGFVVDTGGLLGRQVRVPLETFETASRDGDTVVLTLSKADIDELPDLHLDDYTTPPAGWMPPPGLGYPPGAYVWPALYTERVPPGAESPEAREEESRGIGKGAAVVDRAGHDVGVIDDVRLDERTARLLSLRIRVGGTLRTLLGGGETVEVDAHQVDRFEMGITHLNVSRDELLERARAAPKD